MFRRIAVVVLLGLTAGSGHETRALAEGSSVISEGSRVISEGPRVISEGSGVLEDAASDQVTQRQHTSLSTHELPLIAETGLPLVRDYSQTLEVLLGTTRSSSGREKDSSSGKTISFSGTTVSFSGTPDTPFGISDTSFGRSNTPLATTDSALATTDSALATTDTVLATTDSPVATTDTPASSVADWSSPTAGWVSVQSGDYTRPGLSSEAVTDSGVTDKRAAQGNRGSVGDKGTRLNDGGIGDKGVSVPPTVISKKTTTEGGTTQGGTSARAITSAQTITSTPAVTSTRQPQRRASTAIKLRPVYDRVLGWRMVPVASEPEIPADTTAPVRAAAAAVGASRGAPGGARTRPKATTPRWLDRVSYDPVSNEFRIIEGLSPKEMAAAKEMLTTATQRAAGGQSTAAAGRSTAAQGGSVLKRENGTASAHGTAVANGTVSANMTGSASVAGPADGTESEKQRTMELSMTAEAPQMVLRIDSDGYIWVLVHIMGVCTVFGLMWFLYSAIVYWADRLRMPLVGSETSTSV